MTEVKPLFPLTRQQIEASAPDEDVWLSASAGTGKTQVLSARVLRLLLNKVAPESILCLTFTKAGATEMAERVHNRLAAWVRAPSKIILNDLAALGERREADNIAFARTLFARVLDARGGGLRIQTIHSFCQTLLANFPAEAELAPGFRPLEEREARKLADTVLADVVRDAVAGGAHGFIAKLQALVLTMSEADVRMYLKACANAGRAFEALDGSLPARVRRSLALPADNVEPLIAQLCDDEHIMRLGLEEIRQLNLNWGTKTGVARAEIIGDWLALPPTSRAEGIEKLAQIWLTQQGEMRSFGSNAPKSPDYSGLCEAQNTYFEKLLDMRRRQQIADHLSDMLTVGQHYARAYAQAKRAIGAVDFNDLIDLTASLLTRPGMGDWIRFKLDQTIDHILVDEAQDTNDKQWAIIKALAEEFYAGHGQKMARRRTIFTVGDTKQAIFGFQGTDPRAMATAREWFDTQARGVDRDLLALNLRESFRSSPPVLQVVDAVVASLGGEALGLIDREITHVSATGVYGQVMLLPLIADGADGQVENVDDDAEQDNTGITLSVQHQLARDLAQRVAQWLHTSLGLENRRAMSGGDVSRALEPKDIMILLRSRSTLAQLIVANLARVGVPVAGIDRLRLNTPLVVRDMLAAMRFALQPNDDLNLACLLVSPLLGWSQEQLQSFATARKKLSLWRYMRATIGEADLKPLRQLLAFGDRLTPSLFIEMLLSGDIRGRERFLTRFGRESIDPLDELLSAAITFERDNVPNLQGFIDWFERDTDDIKREPGASENAVRVLTVHGSKGLQAPLVILADAARDPENNRERKMIWRLDEVDVPIIRPTGATKLAEFEQVLNATKARAFEEHWRLLYVALTRAEEQLVVAGALGARPLSDKSWYHAVEKALIKLGCNRDDAGVMAFGEAAPSTSAEPVGATPPTSPRERPDWVHIAAPKEARPARPLAPSNYTDDLTAAPPPHLATRRAAQRGKVLHSLFERLPGVAAAHRIQVADVWLENTALLTDASERSALISDALRIIENDEFADIFGDTALAEAPIAGVVDGVVIAGTVDRLVVTQTHVTIIDFKTARRVPSSAQVIPEAHLRQMSAYAAVLQHIFPDREVRAALLYTSGPTMFVLDPAELDAHKPSYHRENETLGDRS